MENVRTIYLDWNTGGIVRSDSGAYLARQYDHLSNLVVIRNAPGLENYYLIVEMKEDEDDLAARSMEPILLSGPYWLVPNVYTQLVQPVTFQVCCKTESGDFEQHSAKFKLNVVESLDHDGSAVDVDPSPMYDAYKDYVDEKVQELIDEAGGISIDTRAYVDQKITEMVAAAGEVIIDSTLSISGAAADAKATGDAISETNERLLSSFPVDTAQGAIASFTDGADNLPLESLVVGIEPVQDLHGYANPWPAGGGKNKLAPWVTTQEHRGVMWTANSDGTFTSSGTADNNSQIISPDFLLPAGEYIISGCPECGTGDTCFFRLLRYNGNTLIGSASDYGSGATFTITGEETRLIVFVSVNANQVAPSGIWKPMVRVSTDPDATFAPYENICPISGWTGVEVTHLGTNFWDEEWETGLISTSNGQNVNGTGIRGKNMCACLPNTTYYAHFGSGGSKYVFWYDESEGFISAVNVTSTHVITSPANARFFRIRNDGLSTYNHDISINYPSTDHDYHEGHVQSINISLDQTVYGGTLDVLSGELVIDRAMVDLGTLNWSYISASGQERFLSSGIKNLVKGPTANTDNANIISSAYNTFNVTHVSEKDKIIAIYTDGDVLIRDTSYTDATAFKTAMSGVQLCYPLATPITVTLTPNELSTLLGANNIWSDAGEVTAEYRADPTLYIQKKIAEAISALS